MAATIARPSTSRLDGHGDKPSRSKQNRSEIWTSLLKQTQVAQSRNRSNAIAHRQLLVCGGSPEEQRTFLASLARPPPPQPLRRARNDNSSVKEKGSLALSNRYAYGYGHLSLFSPQQGSFGGAALGTESEEVAHLRFHCVPEPEITYEPVLRRILVEPVVKDDEDQEDLVDHADAEATPQRPAVQILLSWKEPWTFLRRLRAWLQLLAKALLPPTAALREEDPVEVLKEHQIKLTIIVQHVEAQQELEREGWTEERFDYVCQVLRTVLLPLHPNSALIYTPSLSAPQQPGAPLTEVQKVIFAGLALNMSSLSPRPSSLGSAAPTKKEELLPRHNVVDRMNIVIPGAWDSAGKVRLLSETFSPEDLLATWSVDLSHSVFPTAIEQQASEENTADITVPNDTSTTRQAEEVFSAEPSSPVPSAPSLPPSPSKAAPSAILIFENQIEDPNAHKAPKPPAITVVTRPEQDFLKEMKAQLDSYAGQDRERAAQSASPARVIAMPPGESTGALDGLGDMSFNVGGVSYNTTSAEAAIERLKRPQPHGIHNDSGTTSSPLSSGSRTGTPRPSRRADHGEGTPGAGTPSNSRADFPSEDLEKYFASLAKKAGGADSRQATPSRS